MQSHLFLQRLLGDAEYLGRHCRHCRDCRQLAALDQPDRFRLPASGFRLLFQCVPRPLFRFAPFLVVKLIFTHQLRSTFFGGKVTTKLS